MNRGLCIIGLILGLPTVVNGSISERERSPIIRRIDSQIALQRQLVAEREQKIVNFFKTKKRTPTNPDHCAEFRELQLEKISVVQVLHGLYLQREFFIKNALKEPGVLLLVQ